MDTDPNAHDPTIGDDGDDDELDFDDAALYGDPDDDAPAFDQASADRLNEGTGFSTPRVSYDQLVRQAQGKSMDDLMREAAERIANPPKPVVEDEEQLEQDVGSATSKALQRGGTCPACGSGELEEDGGALTCKGCGMSTAAAGPRIWSVIGSDDDRVPCCSELCAKVAAAQTDGEIVQPAPWPEADAPDCYACGGEIETPDGGS